jgi:hypothetical protein
VVSLAGAASQGTAPDSTAVVVAEVGQQASPPPARPCDEQAVADGVNALRDLAAAPSGLAVVSTWLRPEHFARPDDGALFAVMRDMHACGMPVDPVTVSCQAARRGLHAEPGSLTGGMGPSAVATCSEVYRHGVLALVAQAGRDIQADAERAGCPVGRLLEQTGERLGSMEIRPRPGAVPEQDHRGPAASHAVGAADAIQLPGHCASRCPAGEPGRQSEREAVR